MSRQLPGRPRIAWRPVAVGLCILLVAVAAWLGAERFRGSEERDLDAASRDANADANAFYEIFVRSFHDSDGDGIGDLNGIAEKLDYIQDMGFSGIWLTPIHPSPSYHGYDVTDYYGIHPDFGTLADFERLVEEARARNIRVILDLVVNHTSSEHPWFLEAQADPASPKRNWYVWADEGANVHAVSAVGGPAWHAVDSGHYLGIFWGGMPDLNPDNPEVLAEMLEVAAFWLDLGVDGFRLDAAKHLYENFPHEHGRPDIMAKNTAWWQAFRSGLEDIRPGVYLVGEVWDSASVIGAYLDRAFDAGFNFDLAEQLINMAGNERATDIGATVRRIHDYYDRVSGGSFEDAVILSNHDQNRVMSRLGGHVGRAKAAAALLLTMPGKPYVYYGEEIGMQGVKPDENLRRPMRWDEVAVQQDDPDSLLNHYKKLLAWRKREPVLAFGTIASFASGHDHMAAYMRVLGEERVLVVHNLSGETQSFAPGEPAQGMNMILQTSEEARFAGGILQLPPYHSAVLK